jgi:5'-methylthioadenosine phosphorylase
MLAIIGGSGLTRLSSLAVAHREVVRTPYGEPSSALLFGQIAEHGRRLSRAPRARPHDSAASRQLPRESLGAQASRRDGDPRRRIGGRHSRCAPGDLVLPHQLIDYTHGRELSFFDGGDQRVVHVDFTHPYSPEMRAKCLAGVPCGRHSARRRRRLRRVSGPRLETAAEIDRMERDGATSWE